MGYLDGDTIVVDAILTKHGRKLLADGRAINPTHFALSDDGVDYTLWNTSSPSGSAGYDDYLSLLPMIEAVPSNEVMMHYNLMSLPQNTRYMPVVILPNSPNTENIFTLDNDVIKKDIAKIEPEIQNWAGQNARFNFKIMDATAINVVSHDGQLVGEAGGDPQPLEQSTPYPVTVANATHLHLLDLTVTANHKTAVTIEHTDSGAQITAYVHVLKSDTI